MHEDIPWFNKHTSYYDRQYKDYRVRWRLESRWEQLRWGRTLRCVLVSQELGDLTADRLQAQNKEQCWWVQASLHLRQTSGCEAATQRTLHTSNGAAVNWYWDTAGEQSEGRHWRADIVSTAVRSEAIHSALSPRDQTIPGHSAERWDGMFKTY